MHRHYYNAMYWLLVEDRKPNRLGTIDTLLNKLFADLVNLQKKGTRCATRMCNAIQLCVCDVSWRAARSVRGNLPPSRLLFLRRTRSTL